MQFWGHQSVQDIIVLHVFIQLLYNMLNKTVQFQLNCSLLLSKMNSTRRFTESNINHLFTYFIMKIYFYICEIFHDTFC